MDIDEETLIMLRTRRRKAQAARTQTRFFWEECPLNRVVVRDGIGERAIVAYRPLLGASPWWRLTLRVADDDT